MALRILVLALAAPCASSLVAPRAHARAATRVHFLSPEMSGAIDKLVNKDKYESIVEETMVKEDCDRAEAERRYNQFLFGPDTRGVPFEARVYSPTQIPTGTR